MANNIRQFKHPIPGRSVGSISDPRLITADELLAVCDLSDKYSVVAWNGLNIIVRDMIGMDEVQSLVLLVLNQCWDGAGYKTELMDYIFRSAVITFYSTASLPDDDDPRYRIVYKTDLYDAVIKNVNKGQLDAIENAIKVYMKI